MVGIVGNAGFSHSFEVQTWLFPWGLLLVILVVLEIILLAITAYFRERRRRKEAAEGRGPAAGPDDARPTGEVPAVGRARWRQPSASAPGGGGGRGGWGREPAGAPASPACLLIAAPPARSVGPAERPGPGVRPGRTGGVCPMMSA